MKSTKIVAIAILLGIPSLGFGQLKSQEQSKINFASLLRYGLQPQGLVGALGLNPDRFHMRQSYSLSYMSGGGQAFSQGVYLNSMRYDISNPLSVSLEWGMLHQPLSAAGVNSPFQNGFFLSNASLEYKPSKNLQIGVQYSTNPYAYPYSYYQRNTLFDPSRRWDNR